MRILTVARLQFRGYFGKKLSWLLAVLLPLVFSFFVLGLFDDQGGGSKIPVVIVDEDRSEYSNLLTDFLKEEPYLKVLEKDLDTALEHLRENRVEGIYRIEEGFEEDIRRDQVPGIIAYTSSLTQGSAAVGEIVISRSIRLLSSARAANLVVSQGEELGGSEEEEALWERIFEQSESYWEPEPLMTLAVEEVLAESGDENSRPSPGTTGVLTGPWGLLIMYITLFSLWVFYRRQEEVFRGLYRRQAQILGERTLYTGKFIGDFLFLSLHQGILLLSIYLFQGRELRGELLHQILLLLVVQILLIGLWSLLSKMTLERGLLVVGLPLGVLITSMIAGALWSPELHPEALQTLSIAFPQGIYMQGVEHSYIGATGAFYTTLLWGTGLGCLFLVAGYLKPSSGGS